MDLDLKGTFEKLFARYFPGGELPLTFYYADAPMKKFAPMVGNLEESFAITRSWEKVMRRLVLGDKA
jgi:hypothetical protein